MQPLQALFLTILLTQITACSPKPEKPVVSVQKFALQKIQMSEVVKKLMAEPNIKLMYAMADGVENTRAVDCSPIGEECNLYYELINKIVNVTRDGDVSDSDRQILDKLRAKFDQEMLSSELKLKQQWKEYINAKS